MATINFIKDNRQEKAFDALDWLAAMISHIPDQREQMVRYYGFYSNVSRGLRKRKIKTPSFPVSWNRMRTPTQSELGEVDSKNSSLSRT
jgi:hypothetical protein